MSDDAVLNALRRRAELTSKISRAEDSIKRWKAQIEEISRFIRQWEKFSGKSVNDLESQTVLKNIGDFQRVESEPESQIRNPKKELVTEEATKILNLAGEPLSRDDLFERLRENGVTLVGANPKMVLSTMLWRTRNNSEIVRLKSGGYALRKMISAGDELGSFTLDLDED